eukprot:5819134-Pleurochrysis_carterae.AAC.1
MDGTQRTSVSVKSNERILRVSGKQWQIAHRDTRSRFSIYPRHGFSARANVHQVTHMRMNVIGTSAVDHESNVSTFVSQVARVAITVAS